MTTSDSIAVLALIISVISLYISWRQYARDKSQLKLSLEFHVQSGQGSGYTLNVVNIGRRPVSVLKGYARLKSGKTTPVYDTLTILGETERWSIDIPLYRFRNLITHPLDIIAFEVEETTGKISRIKTRKIGKDVRKAWMPDVDWLNKSESA